MKRNPSRFAFAALSLALTLAACDQTSLPTTSITPDADEELARVSGQVIPGQYIVVLKDPSQFAGKTVRQTLDEMTNADGVESEHVYTSALLGFSGHLTDEALSRLKSDPMVDYIE